MKTVIITGGNSGLGYQCAKQLAKTGKWHIVIASRNLGRIQTAIQALKDETGTDPFEAAEVDLASIESVRRFAAEFKSGDRPPLHAIVCNAGLTLLQNETSKDGLDLIFAVNHLGHYLMVHLLSPVLARPGRVVFVSSGTHIPEHKLARRMQVPSPNYTKAIDLAYPDRVSAENRIEGASQRYSTSKLCNVLATYEFATRFDEADLDVKVFAIDPGLMPGTGLARSAPKFAQRIFGAIIRFADRWVEGIRLPDVSGQHLARLVTDPELHRKTALYFDGDTVATSSADSYDRAKMIDLWNTSSQLTDLQPTETILPVQV